MVRAEKPSGHGVRRCRVTSKRTEVLARLCGHSPRQAEELLDRLVASRSLAAWHYCRDTEEVAWRLSLQVRVGRAAVQQ